MLFDIKSILAVKGLKGETFVSNLGIGGSNLQRDFLQNHSLPPLPLICNISVRRQDDSFLCFILSSLIVHKHRLRISTTLFIALKTINHMTGSKN